MSDLFKEVLETKPQLMECIEKKIELFIFRDQG